MGNMNQLLSIGEIDSIINNFKQKGPGLCGFTGEFW
jgi:hypothetical protein